MKTLFLIIFILVSPVCFATIHQVGSSKNFKTPNELYLAEVVQTGDTIEIDGETFSGETTLAVWYADSLLLRGVNGRPHLIADGKYIHQKGIWVIKGHNCTVENIEFSGASVPDKNGAGIRLDGTGITIRHCYFHDCEDVILTSNPEDGNILIEYTEFAHCGYGNGYSHNLYVGHVNSLTFRFNYTHHCKVGHCLKSRAQNNFIYYNYFADENDGYSSRLIDLPNGGFTIVMGNILMQGQEAINGNAFGYGLEGLINEAPHELYTINNTFVNKRSGARFVSVKEGTSVVNLSNNIFAGTGTVLEGTATTFENNVIETNITSLKFLNENNFDYHLTSTSPAIDAGASINDMNGLSLTPDFEYVHQMQSTKRTINENIDAGAFEYDSGTAAHSHTFSSFLVYPNPVQKVLHIEGTTKNRQISVYNITGKLVLKRQTEGFSTNIDTGGFPKGIYILQLENEKGIKSLKFVKN